MLVVFKSNAIKVFWSNFIWSKRTFKIILYYECNGSRIVCQITCQPHHFYFIRKVQSCIHGKVEIFQCQNYKSIKPQNKKCVDG